MGLFDAPLRLVYESFKMRHLYRNWVARVGYCLDTEQGYFRIYYWYTEHQFLGVFF